MKQKWLLFRDPFSFYKKKKKKGTVPHVLISKLLFSLNQ